MSRQGSIAPKERVNIVYRPASSKGNEEVELPLKVLMAGDYTLRPDRTALEDRKAVNVDKDNFNAVMAGHQLALDVTVPDRLSNEQGAEMNVGLKFEALSDFEPEGIVSRVPELRKLIELRAALASLKSPLTNGRSFGRKIQELLGDGAGRERLMRELGLSGPDEGAEGSGAR